MIIKDEQWYLDVEKCARKPSDPEDAEAYYRLIEKGAIGNNG